MERVVRYASRRPMPVALVAGVASTGALAAVRSLERAGAPVLALDHRPDAVGLRSRRALSLHGPPPGAEPERLLELLVRVGRALGRRAVLIPTSPEYVECLSAARDRLAPYFHCQFPERVLVDAVRAAGAVEGEGDVVVAVQLGEDGDVRAAFVHAEGRPADEGTSRAAAVDLLRSLGVVGPAWVELRERGDVVRAGAYLWPRHALAARAGVDLPRVAYWSALGARLPHPGHAARGGLDRPFAARDPGPGLPIAGRLLGRVRS